MQGNVIYTHLWNGKILKTDPRIELMGEIDEVIGYLSVAKVTNGKSNIDSVIKTLQQDLMTLAGVTARDDGVVPSMSNKFLDEQIPLWDKEADGFILFGENMPSSFLNLARAVTRRAERRSVQLYQDGKLDISIVDYLNKLSTLLFYLAVAEIK